MQKHLAIAQQDEVVQKRLHVAHEVGGKDDGRLRPIRANNRLQDVIAGRRIHAADGLVQKIQRRVTGHDERELHLLNGALGKRRARGALGNAEPSEHVPGQGGVEVLVEVGEEGDHLAHAHGTGEVGPLGQVGDERLRFRAHLIARHANVARRRMGHAGDHLQQRGLARAVRAEQPYDAAGGQADSKAVERHRGAIALSEVAALEQGRRRDFGDKGIHGKPPHRSESLAPS